MIRPMQQWAEDLPPEAREYYYRQMRVIAEEMPSGTHRMRALAWRALARRCAFAAVKHETEADRQDGAMQSERPASSASVARAQRFVRSQGVARAMIADAVPGPLPGDLVALTDDGEALLIRDYEARPLEKTQLGFTDALGYVQTVEIEVDRGPGNEDDAS